MKASFLCTVLLEDLSSHHLAFQVGMYAVEMPRLPSTTKAMEVGRVNRCRPVQDRASAQACVTA